jgi:hypothetical protein
MGSTLLNRELSPICDIASYLENIGEYFNVMWSLRFPSSNKMSFKMLLWQKMAMHVNLFQNQVSAPSVAISVMSVR